ncbi:putative GABA transporter [Xylaria bambusicola]|uniref:putative GABA transporter n=1 Tax=Xylaria bambusicola TaxID=326684 RepID=UPI002008E413|nr:putative GABA transporter [Xylaria bambusicola]KAI0517029.1 putative GABA transporter [Xylaria bambusicola]
MMATESMELNSRGIRFEHSSEDKTDEQARIQDDLTLRRLGKRPLLTRSFGFMSILGLSCSALSSWEGTLGTTPPALLIAGPAGVLWAFVVSWIGTMSVTATMAELASAAPTAGGQYYWVAMIAPESCAAFLTYLTAWLTTLAWQAAALTSNYTTATILQGIIVLTTPSYVARQWHTILIIYAVTFFTVAINFTTSRTLAKIEGLILILHLAGFFGILVPLVYFAPHNTASFVFETIRNDHGWPSQGVAFLVGLPTVASALIGADCAVHMSEEIQSASTVVPKALIYTLLLNGTLAFALLIGFLFSISDLEAAVKSSSTMFYPFLHVFRSAVKSTAGAAAMASIIFVLAVASTIGSYATASRMLWSFARDRGVPLSQHLVKLNKNALPTNAIIATTGTTIILSLIVLASSVALAALLSLVIAALFSSYLLSCSLLLWRRCTSTSGRGISRDEGMQWGPWRILEPFGTINNIIACMYATLLLFWSFWPQSPNPSPGRFNWSVLVFGATLLFSVTWYWARAHRHFRGPVKEV